MPIFSADLHIHSPHSIAVSQKLNLDTMNATAQMKGLDILSTGDVTQPNWRKYLKDNLDYSNGVYSYKDLNFIIGTELEDNESIHHVVLLPDLRAAEQLQQKLDPFVKNIDGKWAGRPHVNESPGFVVDLIHDLGGICGPAHAFTPFKSIFRQGRFESLEEAYGKHLKNVAFLELGLSANTHLADRMECLQDITFLSNSDAHSEGPQSLGREFNRMELQAPSFEEVKKACLRQGGRKVTLNVGLDPRLGKYFIMFCGQCRRRVRFHYDTTAPTSKKTSQSNPLQMAPLKPEITDDFLDYHLPSESLYQDLLRKCEKSQFECPVCKAEKLKAAKKKKSMPKTFPKISLGVSERINELATWDVPHHPAHRPKYLSMIPLIEMIRKIKGIKSTSSKAVMKLYNEIIAAKGHEFAILVDMDLADLEEYEDGKLASIIGAFRNDQIKYIPGGGGVFGEIHIDEE